MYSSMTSYPPPDQYPRLTKTISQSAAAGSGSGAGAGAGAGANFPLDMDMDMSVSVNLSAGGAFDPSDNSGLPETDWFSTNNRSASGSNFNMSTLSPRVMTPMDLFGEGAGAGAAPGAGPPHMFQGTGAPPTPTATLAPTPPTPTPAPQWQQLLNDLHPYNTYTQLQPQSQSPSQSQSQPQPQSQSPSQPPRQPLIQSLPYLDAHHAHAHPQWDSVWAAPPSPPPPFVSAHQLSVSSSSSASPSSDSDSLPSQGSPTAAPTPAPHMLMSNQTLDTYAYSATATPTPSPIPTPLPQPVYKKEPVEPEPIMDSVPTPSHGTRGKPKATAPPRNEPQVDTSSMSPRARHRSVEAKRRAKEMAAMNELMELHRLRHEHDAAPIALEEDEEEDTNTNTRSKAKGKQKGKGKPKAKVAASDKAAVLAETAQVIKALSARVAELSRALEQQSASAQSNPQSHPHSSHDPSRSSAPSSAAHGKRKHALDEGGADAGAGAGAGAAGAPWADSEDLLELDSRATKTRLLDPDHQQQVRFLTRWARDTQGQAQQSQSQSPIRGEWEDDSPVSLSPPSSSSPSSSSSSPFSPSSLSGALPPTGAMMVLGCKLSPESPWALSLAGHVDRAARSVIDSSLHEHLFRNASVSIVVIDMLGRLIDCNTAFEEMTGMSRVAVAGKMMSAMSTFIPAITGRAPVTSVLDGLREQQKQQQQYHPQPLASMDPMFPFPETVLGLRKLVVKQEEAVAVVHRSCAFGTYKEVRVVHWLVSDSQGKPYAIVGCTTKDDLLYRGPIDAPATIERAKAARQHTVNSIEHLQQLLEALPLPSSDFAAATATATTTST